MRNSSATTLVFCILVLSGCATQGSLDSVRNDLNTVKTRLFSVERELGGIRNESTTKVSALENELRAETEAIRKIAADSQATSEANRDEIQMLNGKLDDVSTNEKKPIEELSRYRDDMDKRIIALEENIIKLQNTVQELSGKTGNTSQQAATPDAIYKQALEVFKAGNTPTAREQFTKFIEQYPEHELAPSARYWIGETFYSEKDYEAAIVTFQDFIKKYPKHSKVPTAMLRQGRAFKAIKDVNSAKYVLKKLRDTYPKSDEAKKARQLLKEIG